MHTKCSRGGESLAHGRCPTSANAPARGTPAGSGRLHGRALGARVASAAPPTASCRCGRAAASKVAHSTGFVLTQTQGRGRVPVRLLQRREYVRRTLTARVPCERARPRAWSHVTFISLSSSSLDVSPSPLPSSISCNHAAERATCPLINPHESRAGNREQPPPWADHDGFHARGEQPLRRGAGERLALSDHVL